MALSEVTGAGDTLAVGVESHTPLLHAAQNKPKSSAGGWKSTYFIMSLVVAERFVNYGISSNLINFMTGPLGQPTATAAKNVNLWSGTASLLPLLGAFIGDTYVGRFRCVIISSLVYILGLGLLTVSAVLPPSCSSDRESATSIVPCSSHFQLTLFYSSLYIVAFGQGGHQPCVQAFGADQFDSDDPEECKARSSFFNWLCFASCALPMVALVILNYIQDNLSWGIGFGIPCIAMGIGLLVFLLGTKTYSYSAGLEERSGFFRIGHVFVKAAMNWRASPCIVPVEEEEAQTALSHQSSQQFRFLNKALSPDGSKKDGNVCSSTDIEEAKMILRLLPIWATCLVYAIVYSQFSTLFTKQGVTMDRSIGPNLEIPSAALQSFISLSIFVLIPVYDRILVPLARAITGEPSGITKLQRIGTGICFSALSMVVAALIEMKRLKTALNYGLIDTPGTMVPMSVWWLVPQYMLIGTSVVFTMVGLQEFFYDNMPSELRSVGLALYLSIIGIGSFLSSFLISIVEKATGGEGGDSWISNNLNRGHLDYFYWLLAGLSATAFVIYLYFAKSFMHNRAGTM